MKTKKYERKNVQKEDLTKLKARNKQKKRPPP